MRTVHFMLTCLCDAFYGDVGRAAVRVLEHAGCRVAFDPRQTCCGQPAFNSGDWAAARTVALHTLDVFRDAETVVTPSASCAGMIRHGYPMLFEGHPRESDARALGRRTFELTEFLVRELGVREWPGQPPGQPPRRVGLHQSCHLRQIGAMGVPLELLGRVGGVEVVPFEEPEQCCGFGGVFSVTFPWVSRGMGERKLGAATAGGIDELVSTDMGCLMHLTGMLRRTGMPVRCTHIAQVLAENLERKALV